MQYRLSTIFLIFFVTAASLALFEAWGLWIAFVFCMSALAFNKAKTPGNAVFFGFLIVLVAIVCPGLFIAVAEPGKREVARRASCSNNLKQIGLALHIYHDKHKHFPPLNILGEDGKPLYNWMVRILPHMEYDNIYEQLHKDEPWDSNHNAGILAQFIPPDFTCPSADRLQNDFSSNYIAVIGSGTMWRKEGTVTIKDLTNTSLTVAAVECVDSDKHWAEPYALTAEEVLDRMKTGEGMRIGSSHPAVILVLFADGNVYPMRADAPISLWRKLLLGKIKNFEELDHWQENSANRSPQFGPWAGVLSFVVWVISVVLLFYRAWTSRSDRKKAETPA
jgi:hypothetical protein